MPKLSMDNICIFISTLKSIRKKVFKEIEYYESTHIENRIDLNCTETLIFLRFKIFYNFLNEHNDFQSFLNDCLVTSYLRILIKTIKCAK